MMTRADKEQEIKYITERLGKSKAAFVVDFKGMKVEQVTQLRKKLHPAGAEMKVVRNTLAKRALKDYPAMDTAISSSFKGTNAFIFSYEDVGASAKVLSQFAKDIEVFQLKTGVMEGKALDSKMIEYISTLPTKDVLRAQFLGVLSAPMGKFLGTLNAVPGGFARVLGAYKDKQSA